MFNSQRLARVTLLLILLSTTISVSTAKQKQRQEGHSSTFCAIADIPYTEAQKGVLRDQLSTQVPADRCAFLIHLGDIRGNDGNACERDEYEQVAAILTAYSPVPVFVLLGDNEWNDCSNEFEAYGYWEDSFLYFDQNWSHSLDVTYQPGRPYNFVIRLEDSLVFGMQIVGGNVPDDTERETRLMEQINWIQEIVLSYIQEQQNNQGRPSGRIVIVSHADPDFRHATFYDPLVEFVENSLKNSHPLLVLNGDTHVWTYNSNWRGQSSILQVILEGEGAEPPTKITINNNGQTVSTQDAFSFGREGVPGSIVACCLSVLQDQFRNAEHFFLSLFSGTT